LIRISGSIKTPLFKRISSPAIVVGPLAASLTILHWYLAALPLWIVLSNAAGINTSHYS